MKQRLIITTLTIFLVAAGSLTAMAQYRGGGYGPGTMMSDNSRGTTDNDWRGRHRGFGQKMMADILGLTDEQLEKMAAIREEGWQGREELREKMRDYSDKMREVTDSGNFDEAAIRALAEEKARIQVELSVAKAKMHSEMHAVMTPEQQELATKLRNVRQNRSGKSRRGPGMGPGSGYNGYGPGNGPCPVPDNERPHRW